MYLVSPNIKFEGVSLSSIQFSRMYNGVNEKQDNESSTGTNMTKAHPNKLPLSEKMTTAFNKQQRQKSGTARPYPPTNHFQKQGLYP
jgi:hypothetical protein